MQKTIVVEIEMRKAHPKYKRVMKSNKKFYAHDEQNSARVGDMVRIREIASAVEAEALDAGRDHSPLGAGSIADEKPNRDANAVQSKQACEESDPPLGVRMTTKSG